MDSNNCKSLLIGFFFFLLFFSSFNLAKEQAGVEKNGGSDAISADSHKLKEPDKFLSVDISEMIDLGLAPFVERALKKASTEDYSGVVFIINTFGGRVDAAVQIRDAILNSKILTIAFVDKRAISAGALISLACEKIYMTNASTIGAATPVQLDETGQNAKPVSEKVVSYFRSEMRSTAEARKRPGNIAEGMVDSSLEIKGIKEKDKLLTLTNNEALKYKISDGTFDNISEALKQSNFKNHSIEKFEINWAERFVRFITNPIINSLLITVGILGIIVEIKTAGFGLSGIIAILSLSLFFFGQYVIKLAGLEEVIFFVLGIFSIIGEFFFLPGFGVLGIAGILLIFGSLIFSLINTNIPIDPSDIYFAVIRVSFSILMTIIALFFLVKYFPSTRFGKKLILSAGISSTTNSDTISNNDLTPLLGKTGITVSILRPSGMALIENKKQSVISQGDFIEKGETIIVTSVDGNTISVKKHGK